MNVHHGSKMGARIRHSGVDGVQSGGLPSQATVTATKHAGKREQRRALNAELIRLLKGRRDHLRKEMTAALRAGGPVIKAVRISGFRNLDDFTWLSSPVLLAVGRNNSGKSNLLSAIAMCFPVLFGEELTYYLDSNGAESGPLPFPYHFVRHPPPAGNPPPAVVQLGTANGGVVVVIQARYNGLEVQWWQIGPGNAAQISGTLYVSQDGSLARLYRGHGPGFSYTRLRNRQWANVLPELDRLQADLWGYVKVTLHRGIRDEGKLLDELGAVLYENSAAVPGLLNTVTTRFGLPSLQFTPILGLPFRAFPTERQREQDRRQAEQLRQVQQIIRERIGTTTTGRRVSRVLQDLVDELTPGEGSETLLGGSLATERLGSAKTLGSGYRALILLCYDLLSADVCLIDEPELFLHPSLQEEVTDFLLEQAHERQMFVTSHSHVILESLFEAENVDVLELEPDLSRSRMLTAGALDLTAAICLLDTWGIRPGQILQANVVVWVEGPSDRIYVNRWIDLWTNGALREGRDYVCVFYGGSLLAHAGIGPQDPVRLALTQVNRNCVLLMDSDRGQPGSPISQTKQRILAEAEISGGLAWVTDGREIENYLPERVLRALGYENLEGDPAFRDVIATIAAATARTTPLDKVRLALSACAILTRADIETDVVLAQRVQRLVEFIISRGRSRLSFKR
jgi:AAA domain, putative AbiEii toxin, Type IV TA system